MVGVYVNHQVADEDRRNLIFEGNLLSASSNSSSIALADHAIGFISEALEPHDPQRAQFNLPVSEFVARIAPLKSAFTNDPRTKTLIREVLTSFGCDLEKTYFDVPRLRIVPHGNYLSSGVSYAYKPHRDIWYSSPTAQVNWWMPVFAIRPESAMAFFPEYWYKPIRNSSADFDYSEWCAIGRRLAVAQVGVDQRKHPLPLDDVRTESELRIAGTKGDLIIFSASQLHATVPNSSGLTRFSIDFRTINVLDLNGRLGGPNIDSRSKGTTTADFIRAADLAPFASV
jgi:hypothetical protein